MTRFPRTVFGALTTATLLSACATPGANLGANVYQANQVNSRQQARVVKILLVTPAKVEVDNSQNQKTAEVVGGLLGAIGGAVLGNNAIRGPGSSAVGGVAGGVAGAAAGSLVSGKVLVNGVSITYEEHGQTFNSAQVGQLCQFAPGNAVVISTSPTETRVQPNATCPSPQAKS